ncbi:SOS response-associated peptidase [Thiocystis minor]|uniref:SOS response-associated peptidase n=1 Tax=Thiocystis minor TaxID=61597 RepID=UPI0030B8BD48
METACAVARSGTELEAQFGASFDGVWLPPRDNIAPGSQLLAVRADSAGPRTFTTFHWGLIPPWAKDRKIGYRTINARAETVAEKPSFRAAFRQRRCLIPADGFDEWQATGSGKQPSFIARRDRQPFAFAGLWETWTDPASGERIDSTTIIVTDANAVVRPIHDRMPVILSPADDEVWLDPGLTRPEPLQALLTPCDPTPLMAYPV